MASSKKTILQVDCPEDVLVSLQESSDQFARDLPLLAAMKLYELGKLSSGMAARLAGMDRVRFLLILERYRVSPFQMGLAELSEDRANA